MIIRFIGQGFNHGTGTSVAQVLIDALANNSYHTFKCLVAFASQAGVSGLTEHINNSKEHIDNYKIIVGVDQKATSKEALEALLGWGVESYVFYASQRNIFHPKIYLFEGDDLVHVIIGSNNLTQMGLVQNIEGSVEITFNKQDIEGVNLLDQITTYFHPILTGDSPNLQPLSEDIINQLLSARIIETEAQRRTQYFKEIDEEEVDEEDESVKITDIFPSIPLQRLPENFNPRRPVRAIDVTQILTPIPAVFAPVVINNNIWNYKDESTILIAEVGGPSRWKQISFAKGNFETFFGLPTNVGTSGQINLKYIENNGIIQNQVEQCISARVKASRNFNLEPLKVRESIVPYNIANRPIIFFIKINGTNFIYHFETSGTQLHTELQRLLPARNGNSIRRPLTTVANLRANCPSISV